MSRRSVIKIGKIKRRRTMMRESFVRGVATWLGVRNITNNDTLPTDIIKITRPNRTNSFDLLYVAVPIMDATRGSRNLRRTLLHQDLSCVFS